MTSVSTFPSTRNEAPLAQGMEEELAGPPHLPAPVQRAARISSLDVLRGFALLGILVVNMDDFAGPEALHDIPLGTTIPAFAGPHAHWNLIALFLKWMFIEGKMRALFCMLFGAGVVLLTSRAERRGAGDKIADIYTRRNLWLLVLGILHGTFLWHGDILFYYSICALLFLYPFRTLKPKTLFLTGTVSLLLLGTSAYFNYLEGFRDLSLGHRMATVVADERAGKPLTPAQRQIQQQWNASVAAHAVDPKDTQQKIADSRKGYLSDVENHGLGFVGRGV